MKPRIAFFDTKSYDKESFTRLNKPYGYDITFLENRLTHETVPLANGHDVVCAFVNDDLSRPVLEALAAGETRLIALRCAGFNNVDLQAARRLGITVARVPSYSPHAVAEHTLALVLGLNRKIHRAFNRVREGNFALEGLLGFDLLGKTVGIVGTGQIGAITAGLFQGFGCTVIAHDMYENPDCVDRGIAYVSRDELFARSDIVSLHCPLTPETRHMIDADTIARMKHGVMIVNTSRGAVIDTPAVLDGLKSGRIGNLALDVYEEEGERRTVADPLAHSLPFGAFAPAELYDLDRLDRELDADVDAAQGLVRRSVGHAPFDAARLRQGRAGAQGQQAHRDGDRRGEVGKDASWHMHAVLSASVGVHGAERLFT